MTFDGRLRALDQGTSAVRYITNLRVDEFPHLILHESLILLTELVKRINSRGPYILCQPKIDYPIGVRLRIPEIVQDVEEYRDLGLESSASS